MKQEFLQRTAVRFLAGDSKGLPAHRWTGIVLILLVCVAVSLRLGGLSQQQNVDAEAPLPALEFSRLVHLFSEAGGSFRSDNFISNETSYLHVADLLQELGVRGGVYLGVGPEQNFSYIALIRPEMAFVVDIRRQAMVQHLYYKALFELARSRQEFLSLWLSRPLADAAVLPAGVSLDQMIRYFARQPPDEAFFEKNLEQVLSRIQKDFLIPLSGEDHAALRTIAEVFREEGVDIRYRSGRFSSYQSSYSGFWGIAFPALSEILLGTDLKGQQRGFLATDDDFFFVKELHRRNRIIPLVGDFAGPSAFRAIGDFLKNRDLKVSAIYVSNVEQYLYQYNRFDLFADNLKSLPLRNSAMFIRAVAGRRSMHPANIPGHRLTTILQRVEAFFAAYASGKLQSYWDLVTTDFIAARQTGNH